MITLTYLQKPLLKPAVYTIAALLFSVFSALQLNEMLVNMENQLAEERTQVETLYQEVNSTLSKLDLVKRYDARFKSLTKDGIIGVQSRAVWIDKLMESLNLYGVTQARIRFSPRDVLQSEQVSTTTDAQLIRYEQITFEGDFQHEQDLLNFMTHLNEHVNELTLVQGCTVTSVLSNDQAISDGARFRRGGGNIQANCQFSFVEVFYHPLSVGE
jgi:hypothetical protein